MSDLLERLATISGIRDRLAIKSLLAQLLHDVLAPASLAAWQRVGADRGNQWLIVTRMGKPSEVTPTEPRILSRLPVADPSWVHGDQQAHESSPDTVIQVLRSRGQVVGAVEVTMPGGLDAAACRALQATARFFDNLQSLVQENESDALTGLLNRRAFDNTFARLACDSRAAAGNANTRPLWSLAVLDIDHFKRVNDEHGHLIGDEVLLMLSQLMKSTLRHVDHMYRFGGEEFVILLPTQHEEAALAAFERLRQAVGDHGFTRVGHITISLGYTRIVGCDTANDAFGRADQAVYWVKQNGRNAVRGFEQLVAEGHLEAPESRSAVELF